MNQRSTCKKKHLLLHYNRIYSNMSKVIINVERELAICVTHSKQSDINRINVENVRGKNAIREIQMNGQEGAQ